MEKINPYVNSTTQRCKKIIKAFLIEDFFHLPQRHRWCTLSCEYLREFSEISKWPSGAWGKLIHGKKSRETDPLSLCCAGQAWVQFGLPLDECGPLVECLLTAVHDEELSDVAFDALSSMVSSSICTSVHLYLRLIFAILFFKRILSVR
jgi:hypothetical protein